MADDKKHEPTITVTATQFADLVRAEVSRFLSSKTPDEMQEEIMATQRGQNRPPLPELLVQCKSPITGATMTVRLIKSKTFPAGRVVEMVDYIRPSGWDKKKIDGGLYHDGEDFPMKNEKGDPHMNYLRWVYETFWQKDWNELQGKPASFLDQWRAGETKAA